MEFLKHHLKINFSRQELLIMLLSVVTSLFAFSLSYAEDNDSQAPIIIVKGETIMTINVGEKYIDEGVIAYDLQQGFITHNVNISGKVDVTKPGTYIVRYSLKDADGNYAEEKTRKITVIGQASQVTKPKIESYNIGELKGNTLEVTFITSEKTQAVIGYGTGNTYTLFSTPERLYKNSHSHTLYNVENGKRYNFIIYVRNSSGLYSYTKNSFINGVKYSPEQGKPVIKPSIPKPAPKPPVKPAPIKPTPKPPVEPAPTKPSAGTITGDCSAGNLSQLQKCLSNSSNKKIGITANLSCNGGECCKSGGAIFNLKNKSNVTIEGNGKTFLRTDKQRNCSLVDVENSQNISFKNITFDDDARDSGCRVRDNCPRMIHIKRSSNISFYNSSIKNGKGYVMYVQQVNGFIFDRSRFTNAGVLGMYIGHGNTPSTNIRITNSYFGSNSTNGLALLGVTGKNLGSNIISGNTFERNHYIGQWEVEPQYGKGLTGGGQVYFARASNVTFKNNIIKNGSCAGCKPSGSAIHGLELSEPNKPSLSNILIENNTFSNNSSYAIYKNVGATLNNVTIRSNTIQGKRTNISGAN